MSVIFNSIIMGFSKFVLTLIHIYYNFNYLQLQKEVLSHYIASKKIFLEIKPRRENKIILDCVILYIIHAQILCIIRERKFYAL